MREQKGKDEEKKETLKCCRPKYKQIITSTGQSTIVIKIVMLKFGYGRERKIGDNEAINIDGETWRYLDDSRNKRKHKPGLSRIGQAKCRKDSDHRADLGHVHVPISTATAMAPEKMCSREI